MPGNEVDLSFKKILFDDAYISDMTMFIFKIKKYY
jgi:hypothetical protein